jgi:hypothetical protein
MTERGDKAGVSEGAAVNAVNGGVCNMERPLADPCPPPRMCCGAQDLTSYRPLCQDCPARRGRGGLR